MIKQKITNYLKKETKEKIEIEILVPEERFGDYSTNLALKLAQIRKEDPMKIAEELKSKILKSKNYLFKEIKIVEPGFINFFLSNEYLQKQVLEVLKKGEKFGQLKIGKKKKTQVEFISANPTGPLHIGNGRGAFFGDTLANVLEKVGYKVEREYFINNAKANNQIKLLGKTGLGEDTAYLNDFLRQKIKDSQFKIQKYKLKIKEKKKLYEEVGIFLAKQIQKDIRNFIEKKLKIKFNNWVSEENFYQKSKIKKTFNWLKKKNLVYQKENAWWIKTSKFGDSKDWVVIRESGEPTYLLSDITYHKDKFERGFKKIINIWGADHQAHVSKIKAVARMFGYKGNLDILISQIVRLKEGKISKRKGEIITLEELIKETGLDVARFFYLTKSLDSQMEFDLRVAKEQNEKNPVYYIQYAHARICSILKKIKTKNPKLKNTIQYLKLLNHPSELNLIKQIIRFPDIIETTAKDYQVQRIPQYALDLATVFHQFYRDCRVLTEKRSLQFARLFLILATKIVLKNTLDLMGISAPLKM